MSHDSSRPPRISSRRRKLAPHALAPAETGEGCTAVADITPVDAARYIGEMTAELAQFARRHELATLAYFLEMAHIEAGDEARRLAPEVAMQVRRRRR